MPSSSASATNDASAIHTSSAAANISQTYAHFIGKQFQLSKHSVYVEEVIAEGGFSIVFIVKSNLNGRKYALKRMYVNNEYDLESCNLEIQIIKSLSEHNKKILRYVDSSIQRVHASDDIYEILLLTKYCRLGGLVQLMNERLNAFAAAQQPRPLLTEPELLKIFCDICEAVADLHSRGIIHRDLKIENILIDDTPDLDANLNDKQFKQQQRKMSNSGQPNYNYVLCDFGSATNKVFDRRTHNYTSHMVQQIADEIQKYTTLSYRSPEMVDLYSNKPITVKSDIWALGCLLYKMCFSQMPFGDSLLAIQDGRYTIPDAKANFYSKQLLAMINYTLEPDPLKRPDIYQVSCLAFQLAKRPCPIKNFENSESPCDINSLPAPLTESEWRKVSTTSSSNFAQQHKNSAVSAKQPTEVVTTVNPRERPKANMNPGSSLLANPITSSNTNSSSSAVKHRAQSSSTANQNKLSISIKPPPPPPSSSAHQSGHTQASSQQHQQPMQMSELNSQMQQLGFDDDFGSANSNTLVASASTTPLVPPPIQPVSFIQTPQQQVAATTMTHSVSHNNQLYRQQQQPASPASNMGNITPSSASNVLDKKSHHRRSASHSSTILLNPQLTPQQQQINQYYQQAPAVSANYMMNPAMTPRLPAPVYDPIQLQQQQLKLQLLHMQQQQQLHQQQQQQFYYQNMPTAGLYPNMVSNNAQAQAQAAALNSHMLAAPHQHQHQHSRSTSTSPNASAAHRQLSSTSAEVMELNEKKTSSSSSSSPSKRQMQHSHVNMSYNPFGDCFTTPSQINDNELFGLEFDRIRHQSVANPNASVSASASATIHDTHSSSIMYNGGIVSATSSSTVEPAAILMAMRSDEKPTKSGSGQSGEKKQARGQLSSSASSNSSSTSFSQSSSLFELRKLSSGSSTSSSSTKSPSPNTLNSKATSSSGSKGKQRVKHKKDQSRLVSNYVFEDDPFRSAPFKHQQPGDRHSNSSSRSSTSMATITNRSTSKKASKKSKSSKSKLTVDAGMPKSAESTSTDPQGSKTPKQQFNSDASAFQPYRRPPDPFLSAPFEN